MPSVILGLPKDIPDRRYTSTTNDVLGILVPQLLTRNGRKRPPLFPL